jgi:hypothetical protein
LAPVITRQELYDLVWSKPMTSMATQFGVSGSYMARVCAVLRVPRPERGYWAKLAVGKAPPKPPLPEAQPGDQVVWSKDGELQEPVRRRPVVRTSTPKRRRVEPVTGTHGLIRGAKAHFEHGRPVEDGKHLRPFKRLLVDITTSSANMDKALGLANDLFNALESAGHRVVIAPPGEQLHCRQIDEHEEPTKAARNDYHRPWRPDRPTVAYVDAVAIGLAVIEMTEKVVMRYLNGKYIREAEYVPPKRSRGYEYHTWTTTQDLACGRIRVVAYSPYRRVDWSQSWQETKHSDLPGQIASIVRSIEGAAPQLVERIEEAEKQAELERRRWEAAREQNRLEEQQRLRQKATDESKSQLEKVIAAWDRTSRIQVFLDGVEARAEVLPEQERKRVLQRLDLARQFVGSNDPMSFLMSWKTPEERYNSSASDAREDDEED